MTVNLFQTDFHDQITSRGSGMFKYQRSIICFFDILGWKQLILDGQTHGITAMLQILSIHDHMQRIKKEGSQISYYQFSDSFVLISSVSDSDAQELFLRIQQIVEYLLEGGVLVRGAVSIGNVQHDHNLLVGPGVIRAYAEIESQLSIYPRIVIDPENEEEISNLVGNDKLFYRSSDGLLIFDYLYLAAKRTIVFDHMKSLVASLSFRTKNPAAKAKIAWLISEFERIESLNLTNRFDEKRAVVSRNDATE